MNLFKKLNDDLALRHSKSLYRSRLIVDSAADIQIQIAGQSYLSFCTNDYLGLANHPEIKKAFIAGAERWGVGSGSAHLVTGHTSAHHQLEEELAQFTGREKVLLFSSGYMANQGVITALMSKHDHVFEDKLNHASLIDAALLSEAKLHRYIHADVASLERQLSFKKQGDALIVTDGVFSMDGDIAPLPEIVLAKEKASAILMVDDAHGFGVLGNQGKGSLEYFNLDAQQVPILMGTLGKALGTSGAFIAADEVVIETLIQKARSYIFTTAPPAAIAEATRIGLKLLASESWRREHLKKLIERFKQGADQLNLPLMLSDTPIQPLLAGSAEQAVTWTEMLKAKGILVTAMRPPTVPAGTARLRITFSANHTEEHVDYLLEALALLNIPDKVKESAS